MLHGGNSSRGPPFKLDKLAILLASTPCKSSSFMMLLVCALLIPVSRRHSVGGLDRTSACVVSSRFALVHTCPCISAIDGHECALGTTTPDGLLIYERTLVQATVIMTLLMRVTQLTEP